MGTIRKTSGMKIVLFSEDIVRVFTIDHIL